MKFKLIKIINGTYGYKKDGTGSVLPKTPSDPPFEVSEAEAKRLIALKVAEYADKEKQEKNPSPED
ncbi:MAG: hypothetical protein FWD48_01170 [Oscillospiraceae bacterium]|nr:hypothetical protein [Oscillospiraceae bacterium]